MLRGYIALALLVLPLWGGAHEVRPAYLRIADTATTAGSPAVASYDVLWRVPVGGLLPEVFEPVFGAECRDASERRTWVMSNVRSSAWRIDCREPLTGKESRIAGLETGVTDVLVRYERADDTTQVARVTPTAPEFTLLEAESWQQVALTYAGLGVEHILLGIDHLLFVLALLIIVVGVRRLVATITAFTVAHSLTLAAAVLGWVYVPQAPVEAVIALSILFVCMEIVHSRQGRPGLTEQWPWLVAFVFGLLHGFGFAGALTDIGIPEHAVPAALLFFNVGVEAGQLLFVAAVLLGWQVLRRIDWPDWAWRVPVYSIGSLAGFWTIARIAGFAF